MTARRVLLDGLARDADIFELVSELAPLHPRDHTFPGEVFIRVAADALDWCRASRADPLPLEGLRERFLPECTFRGRENTKLQYAALAAAALHGGTEPDLLDEVAWWQTDDGPAGSCPVDDAVRPVSVAGALAGRVARRGGGMAPGRGWSADRAVAGLYLAHYQALVRQAAMMVRDARVAEEVVQGSFVAVHGGWPGLGDARAAEDYLRQEVANRSRAVRRHGAGRGGGPQQLRPGGSGEHLARAARVAQLMTAVNGRVGQHVSSHLRVARAARALTAVGALDDGVAGQVLGDLELALAARRAVSPGWIGPVQSWWWRPWPVRPEPAGPAAGAVRVVRLGQVIPVRDQDTDGEVYLLSYAHTAAGPQLSVLAPARRGPVPPGQPEPHRPVIPPGNGPGSPLIDGWLPASRLGQFTAADDQGTRYQMTVLPMAGGPDGWTLLLHPRPGARAAVAGPDHQRRPARRAPGPDPAGPGAAGRPGDGHHSTGQPRRASAAGHRGEAAHDTASRQQRA